MARFYGWTHAEMMDMSGEEFSMYRKGMETIIAQEDLMDLEISCAPHMKESSRRNIYKRLQKQSNPLPPKAMTHEDMARILNG